MTPTLAITVDPRLLPRPCPGDDGPAIGPARAAYRTAVRRYRDSLRLSATRPLRCSCIVSHSRPTHPMPHFSIGQAARPTAEPARCVRERDDQRVSCLPAGAGRPGALEPPGFPHHEPRKRMIALSAIPRVMSSELFINGIWECQDPTTHPHLIPLVRGDSNCLASQRKNT